MCQILTKQREYFICFFLFCRSQRYKENLKHKQRLAAAVTDLFKDKESKNNNVVVDTVDTKWVEESKDTHIEVTEETEVKEQTGHVITPVTAYELADDSHTDDMVVERRKTYNGNIFTQL